MAKRLRCLLAAPTGRAAKRMSEATGPAGRHAPPAPGAAAGRPGAHGPDHPLEADLVIVDEVSMLDAILANQLVKAIAPGTHLLLVGDPDQLPSVGAGDVLADLLRSERFPVTRLTHIFRQGAGSGHRRQCPAHQRGRSCPRFGGETRRLLLPAGRGPGGGGRARRRPGRPAAAGPLRLPGRARSRCSRRCTAARPGWGR